MAAVGQAVILVVEDDPSIHALLVDLLRGDGYAVEEAWDGGEAVRLLDQHQPPSHHLSLVLLDLMLPQVDGIAVLRHLARLGDYVPTVALSASGESLRAAQVAGASTMVPKPFDIDNLLAIVAHRCRQK